MRFIKYTLPVLVWMGVIFYFSSRPRIQVSEVYAVQFLVFKTLHVIEYGLLYSLIYRSLKNTRKAPSWQNLYDALLYAVIYAITDEVHQVFIPTREGRVRDIFIDSIGITLALICVWKLLPTAPKKLKNWAKKLQLI